MKKPNLFVWLVLAGLIKIYTMCLGLKIVKQVKIKGPAIVLGNHNAFMDYMFSTSALYPRRVTYLAAAKMFKEPHRRPFLKLGRAIPKTMFESDLGAIKSTFEILKQQGIVCIYPEGQVSYHGTSLTPPYAIAKLLKKAKVPVYVCLIKNAYLFSPPWSKRKFKGKVQVELSQLFNRASLSQLEESEIYQKVSNAIYFNTGAFNREEKLPYRVQPIQGLEPLLYQCPACLYEGLQAKQNTLVCPKCQHTLVYDAYGFLNGKSVYEWFQLQQSRLIEIIDKTKDYRLSIPVRLVRYVGKGLGEVGQGTFTVTKDKYVYQGTDKGENKQYEFLTKVIEYLPVDIGKNVQMYVDHEIYIFEMNDPIMTTKMFITGEYYYQLSKTKP